MTLIDYSVISSFFFVKSELALTYAFLLGSQYCTCLDYWASSDSFLLAQKSVNKSGACNMTFGSLVIMLIFYYTFVWVQIWVFSLKRGPCHPSGAVRGSVVRRRGSAGRVPLSLVDQTLWDASSTNHPPRSVFELCSNFEW